MPGVSPVNKLLLALFIASATGAIISYVKFEFPFVTDTVTSEVNNGQLGVVAAKVRSVGGFNGLIVMVLVVNVQLLASRIVMV